MSKHVVPGTTRFCCLPDGVIRVPEMATVHFRMSLIRSYIRRRIARMKSHLLRYSKLIRHSLKGLIATSLRTLNAALLAIRDKNMKIKLQHSWWFFLFYRYYLFIPEGIKHIANTTHNKKMLWRYLKYNNTIFIYWILFLFMFVYYSQSYWLWIIMYLIQFDKIKLRKRQYLYYI